MKTVVRAFALLFALVLVAPEELSAQARIAPGVYELVPDSNYAAGFDVSGVLIEVTATTMTASQAGAVLVKSTLSYTGDNLTMTDTEGQLVCPTASVYKISTTTKGVRMTPVDDGCAERATVLSQVTLVKKG